MLIALAGPAVRGETGDGYAVVISATTAAAADWRVVRDELVARHQARVITFTNSVDDALDGLRRQFPRYACFLARPEEVTGTFVRSVHGLTRRLDEDPYTDCFWGILTGYEPADALRIARERTPLTIRRVASGTEVALDMVESGVWFCELNQNKVVRKQAGGQPVVSKGPSDTTKALVDALNEFQPGLFVTSGHATERDWMIGFRYKNGFFRHADGKLFGEDMKGNKFAVASPNPKVYLPVGNCLMGHIDRRDCMATSWMHSAGVNQMLGYIVPSWYGYMGWGVLDYFVEQPGRYTLTEAFFANQHALMHRLLTYFPELAGAEADENGRMRVTPGISDAAKAAGLTANDARGLVFDRDVVAFYGDPAWEARMSEQPVAFGQTLTEQAGVFTFTIQPQRGADSFKPINTNGSQRGGRPFVAFLPRRVSDVKLLSGAELNPVVTDNFILVPNPRVCDPSREYRVQFTARPAEPSQAR